MLLQHGFLVIDNAALHKSKVTQNMITDASYILEYIPTYSPDLKPIEHKWPQG